MLTFVESVCAIIHKLFMSIISLYLNNPLVQIFWGFPGGSDGKAPACHVRDPPLGWEDPLEKGMAAYSSILAWRISWKEESGGLQSMESQRVGHN